MSQIMPESETRVAPPAVASKLRARDSRREGARSSPTLFMIWSLNERL